MRVTLVLIGLSAFLLADAVPSLIVTSDSSSSEVYCPGRVAFTCKAVDIPVVFHWELNNTNIGQYTFNRTDQYPLDLTVTSPLIESIQIDSVTLHGNSLNVISTLSVSNVSILEGSSLHCEDLFQRESNRVKIAAIRQGPPAPLFICSSVNQTLTLQLSPPYIADHSVEQYSVEVNPEALNCSRENVKSDTYFICSGLDLGTVYTVTINAINCGDQLSENTSFSVLPQNLVPDSPQNFQVIVLNGMLHLSWLESNVAMGTCLFSGATNYTVILEDSDEMRAEETTFFCENGNCSAIIYTSALICRVGIFARNEHGKSNVTYYDVGTCDPSERDGHNITTIVISTIFSIIIIITIIIIILLGFLLHQKKCSKKKNLLEGDQHGNSWKYTKEPKQLNQPPDDQVNKELDSVDEFAMKGQTRART